jgi:cyclohexa-1,5-dienecarbonyl-CoA hydratase
MEFRTIQFFPGPRVVSVVLNRPPLNIINIEMIDEISVALDEIEDLDSRVVVFSGAGELAFSAGVDVADHVPDRVETMLRKFHDVLDRVYRSDCVTIAAIHGHTLGGGAELAMVCDFIVAADDARMGLPEIHLACFPPAAAAYLPRAIGFQKASEILLLGEPIDPEEAQRIGLVVNRVVASADLNDAVDDYVARLLGKSSAALALTKAALREGLDHRFEHALDKTERLYLKKLVKTEDMQEGIQAFLEKRAPAWKNR